MNPTTTLSTKPRWSLPMIIMVAISSIALLTGGALTIGAIFTSQATVSGHDIETATVQIQAGAASSSGPISSDGLLPGDELTAEIRVVNTGNADVYYTVRLPMLAPEAAPEMATEADPGEGAALAEALLVTVITEDSIEQRTLAQWQEGGLQVAVGLAAGADTQVVVSVELPLEVTNELQAARAEFAVQLDAIQAKNVEAPTAGWVAD